MSSNSSSSSSSGIGFVGALTIAFIVLKLCGIISWPWVWVLSPIWITSLIVVAILVIVGMLILIAYLVDRRNDAQSAPESEDQVADRITADRRKKEPWRGEG